jgi:hypothetical protein
MKTYQKPVMIALSLTGNEQLCGSCIDASIKLYNDQTGAALAIDRLSGNGDGVLTRAEVSNLFGFEDNCKHPTEIYCKFTSAQTVAWS